MATPLMTASTGGSSAPRMNLYELQAYFFQLDEQETISPAASKLYFWWLNQFNDEHWPASLSRKLKVVAATVNMDEKTVAAAAAKLQERGLLHYDAGNKSVAAVWWLNYNPAADSPQMKRNNSGQSDSDSSQMNRKNSASNRKKTPDSSQMNRKNSGHIYKEEYKDEYKDKDPLPGAGAGEAEQDSSLPEQPSSEAPSPRCAAPSSPAAAELSDDEFAQYRAVPRDVEMVDAYLAQINHPKAGKGALFFDYYESRGWRHGQYSHRCENWRALVRGFGFRETQGGGGAAPGQPVKTSTNFSAAAQAKRPTR